MKEYNETIKYVETTEPDKVAEYISELKRQLAEKDEEILVLKSFIKREIPNDYAEIKAIKNIHDLDDDGFVITFDDFYIINERKIRHQVCEEIREKSEKLKYFEEDWYVISMDNVVEILDQIEKGEKE